MWFLSLSRGRSAYWGADAPYHLSLCFVQKAPQKTHTVTAVKTLL